jgi:hypothetical protein
MLMNGETGKGPALDAALLALRTGDIDEVLAMIPKEHENTIRNLFEKTACELRTGEDGKDTTINWYLKTVHQLHRPGAGSAGSPVENYRSTHKH